MKSFCSDRIKLIILNGFLFFLGCFICPVTGLSEERVADNSEKFESFLQAAVSLEITAEPSVVTDAGTEIVYTYTVTNVGDEILTGVKVTDNALGVINLNPSIIEPEGTAVGTGNYIVFQDVIDAGVDLINAATAESAQGATGDATVSVSIIQTPEATFTKSAISAEYRAEGDEIEYLLVLRNTGNVTLTDITVTDPLTQLISYMDRLAPDNSEEIPTTYIVTQDDVIAGTVNNTATAAGRNFPDVSDSASVSLLQEPGLSIDKTSSTASFRSAGDTINYSILVSNTGNTTFASIDVIDPLTELSETVIGFAPQATQTFNTSYTIAQDDLVTGSVTNIATVSAGTLEVSDNITLSLLQEPALSVTKTTEATFYDSTDDVLDYNIEVVNTGNTTFGSVTVTDPLTGMNETISDFAPGATESFTTSYTVQQSDIDEGSVTNTVTVSDGGTLVVSDDVTVSATATPALSVTKATEDTFYDSVGDVLNYTIEVVNTGNTTIGNVIITDPLTGMNETISDFAPGATESFTTSYTVQQSDIDEGSVTNTVTVSDGGTLVVSDDVTVSATATPALSVTKATEDTFYDSVGDVLNYTIEVVNTGNTTIGNVIITDPLTGMNETISNFAPGATESFTTSYTVQQSDIDEGSVTNTVTVSDGGILVVSDDVTVSATATPALSVTKATEDTFYDSVGDVLNYTIEVVNTGNTTIGNVILNDPLTGMNETISNFAPGATETFTTSYTVQQSDIDEGSVTNTVTVSDGGTLVVSDDVTVSATATPALSVTKTTEDTFYDSAGDVLNYTIEVVNTGNTTIGSVTVEDPLTGLSETISNFAPGATESFTTSYTVQQSDIDEGSVTNTVTVKDGGTLEVSDDVTVSAAANAALSVTKTTEDTSFESAGDVLDYVIEVVNTGNTTIGNVTVSDPLTGMNETLNNFAPGSSQTFTTSYTVQQSDLNAGSVTNIVTASDGNSLNVSDEITVSGAMNPGISITKTASPTAYSVVGAIINYDIVVENTGNVNLTNVVVTDQMLDLNETVEDLAPGSSASFEGTYVIAQVDLNNGSLDNTAYVSGNDPDGNVVSDSDQVSVTANQNAAIAVNKAASPITFASVGDEITYTITVENTGNVILTGVVVSDPLTGMEESIALLLPGQTETFIQTLSINQTHLNSGTLTNTVTAEGNGPLFNQVSDSDQVTVTAVQAPGISVNKTAGQETFKAVGEQLNYTIVVENTGNVTLTDVAVSDPLTQLNESVGNLAPGEERSFSTTYSIVQSDLDQGMVINTVTASAVLGGETIEADAEAVVSALFPPVANDDISADHMSGNIAVVNILENDLLSDGSPALPGLVTVDINLQADGVQTSLEVQGEGNWSYNSQSGELTFSPVSGFTTDPAPVSYLLTENSTGLNDEASVTVDYNEGEPFAFNDSSTDNIPGEPVTLNILSNDKLSDGSPASSQQVTIDIDITQAGIQTERAVSGEGSWVYNPETGELVFTPLPGYSTDPTPLTYMLIENLTNLNDEGTVIIGYDEQPPVAGDDSSSGHAPGEAATLNLLDNDFLGDETQALPEQVTIDVDLTRAGIQNEFESPAEGLWSLDASTGDITFTPVTGFTGNPEPITYRLTEVLTGLADTATVIFIYSEEAPVAADDSSVENQPGTEVSINILENDLLSDGSMAEPQLVLVDFDPITDGLQHEIVVEGEGIWMYNEVTGILTFSPENGLIDDPSPVSYTLCSVWNPQVCSEAEVIIGYRQDPSMASIALIKTGTYSPEDEIINYSFEVTNTGSLPVWNITITDELLETANLQVAPDTLQPGARGSVTATYQVTLADKNRGSVTNSAVAEGFILEGERVGDISGSTVDDDEPTVTVIKQLAIKKQTVGNLDEALVNQEVEFSLIVYNRGNDTLANVYVEDPLTGFDLNTGKLSPGDSIVYYTTYTVRPEDEQIGEFVNTAYVSATSADGSELDDSSSVVVFIVSPCDMVIPNGFSPNDDGIQDEWKIPCLENYPNARVEIFNRWGNRVFEKENFGNTDVHGIADAWWDGYSTSKRTFGSDKLPAGTYYYILYLQPGQEPLNGFIFLNR